MQYEHKLSKKALKTIANYDQRIRRAIKKYGDDSTIVKEMKKRASMVTELEWGDKAILMNKKNASVTFEVEEKADTEEAKKKAKELAKYKAAYFERRIQKYIGENSEVNVIKKIIPKDEMKEIKKIKDKETKYKAINTKIQEVAATMALIEQIWKDMYDLHYSIDECNQVYDELKAGKFRVTLARYMSREIELPELADIILRQDEINLREEYDIFE